MGADSKEHNCFSGQIVAKAISAIGDVFAFFTNNEYDPKVTIDADAAAANQIQSATDIAKRFRVYVRVVKDSLNPALDASRIDA